MTSNAVSLSTKISDFLYLMKQAYDREMAEEKTPARESSQDPCERCKQCKSKICKMVRSCNAGLVCWQVYCENPDEIIKYWFTGKVIPEMLAHGKG